MDQTRFDALAKWLASTRFGSRRALLRRVGAVAVAVAVLGSRRHPRPAAAGACDPPCPLDQICEDGICLSILLSGGCPAGCAPGFVCSGDRCVMERRSDCGLCELPDAKGECLYSCADGAFCVYDVDAKGDWTSWTCEPEAGPEHCHTCDGTFCQNACMTEEYCLVGPGVCRPCDRCARDIRCGDLSTEKLCCEAPNWAYCFCESSPGAGDGRVGCCGAPGNPCPKPYASYLMSEPGQGMVIGFGDAFPRRAGFANLHPNCRPSTAGILCTGTL